MKNGAKIKNALPLTTRRKVDRIEGRGGKPPTKKGEAKKISLPALTTLRAAVRLKGRGETSRRSLKTEYEW
jgi:hypothetical protein